MVVATALMVQQVGPYKVRVYPWVIHLVSGTIEVDDAKQDGKAGESNGRGVQRALDGRDSEGRRVRVPRGRQEEKEAEEEVLCPAASPRQVLTKPTVGRRRNWFYSMWE